MAQIDVDIGFHKITAVITRDALDALGFITGQIFAAAHDYEVRAVGRAQFTAALKQGLGDTEGPSLH